MTRTTSYGQRNSREFPTYKNFFVQDLSHSYNSMNQTIFSKLCNRKWKNFWSLFLICCRVSEYRALTNWRPQSSLFYLRQEIIHLNVSASWLPARVSKVLGSVCGKASATSKHSYRSESVPSCTLASNSYRVSSISDSSEKSTKISSIGTL